MTSRSCLCLALVVCSLTLAGCGDAFTVGPPPYVENERLGTELKDKPKLRAKVRQALSKLFGPNTEVIHVPPGSGLPNGGIRLASRRQVEKDGHTVIQRILVPTVSADGQTVNVRQDGGHALYRIHCLHCHGASGAGDGPTAPFLYPRPRDYRKGLFKFTSTATGAKPSREDLRKTIRNGLNGTSMPAFEAQMTPDQIEQVIDYVIFLSMRGETESALIEEALISDEQDPEALSDDVVEELVQGVANKWKQAESQVVNPPVPRTPPSRESILLGRHLFLGGIAKNKQGQDVKVDCISCHGTKALGDGPSFVSQAVFNDVVFYGDPSTMSERLAKYDEATREAWKNSLDDWGNPLRPANLNRGVYKGGRRPIDLYWRIAKGINGAKMPAHYPAVEPEHIWALVNFVLELPYEPELLEGATLPGAIPVPPGAAVARR